MKLSKEYILERLQTTSVHDLALEIAQNTSKEYPSYYVDMEATVAKFEKQLAPLAPIKAVDLMRAHGVEVTQL